MSDIKSINKLTIYDEEARKNIDTLRINKIDDITTKDYKLVLKANDVVKKEIEIPSKVKTVNNVLPDISGNITVAANQIQEYDDYGMDKGNVHNYINHFSLESVTNKNKFKELDVQFNKIEQKADKTEVDIERKRIDTFIALPNGSTTNDARLEDIKVGADNVNYASPGEAVRTQFTNNNTKIQENINKNLEQDDRLSKVESKNKSQDVYLNGLFNEDSNGRLTNQGIGNELKLEGSKAGLVTIDNIVGDSLVNNVPSVNPSDKWSYGSNLKLSNGKLVTIVATELPNVIIPFNFPINKGTNIIIKCTIIPPVGCTSLNICLRDVVNNTNHTIEKINCESKQYNLEYNITTQYNYATNNKDIGLQIVFGFTDQSLAINKEYVIKDLFVGEISTIVPEQAFSGIQSSFEDKLITQEMVDNKKELAVNLGKYKVNGKTVGKNKLSPKAFNTINNPTATGVYNKESRSINVRTSTSLAWSHCYIEVPVKPNTRYILSAKAIITSGLQEISIRRTDESILTLIANSNADDVNIYRVFNSGESTVLRFKFYCTRNTSEIGNVTYEDIQLEEVLETQTQPSIHVPYVEYEDNLYLIKPLLKGDELVSKNDGVYHIHNSEKTIFNGSEGWNISSEFENTYRFTYKNLKAKPITTVINDKFPSIINSQDSEHIFIDGSTPYGVIHLYINKSKLNNNFNLENLKAWLKSNPTTVIYELAEPWEEKISDNKFLLEIPDNATLTLDSNIPVTSVKTKYTSSIVSVVKLDKVQYEQDKVALDNAYRMTILEIATGIKI